jgi:hypothetical protein
MRVAPVPLPLQDGSSSTAVTRENLGGQRVGQEGEWVRVGEGEG